MLRYIWNVYVQGLTYYKCEICDNVFYSSYNTSEGFCSKDCLCVYIHRLHLEKPQDVNNNGRSVEREEQTLDA